MNDCKIHGVNYILCLLSILYKIASLNASDDSIPVNRQEIFQGEREETHEEIIFEIHIVFAYFWFKWYCCQLHNTQ